MRFRVLVLGALAFGPIANGQGVEQIQKSYRKREVYIDMRDGTRLFTSIYEPRDTTRSYPILMSRTPYSIGPYGDSTFRASLGPSPAFATDGYIFVYQDVRGRYMSEGVYQYMTPHLEKKTGPKDVDESTDTYDTIEWLLKNVAHNNGRVGTYGISAPGFLGSRKAAMLAAKLRSRRRNCKACGVENVAK